MGKLGRGIRPSCLSGEGVLARGRELPVIKVGEAFDYRDRRVGIMELPVQPSSKPSGGKNFEKAPWCYLLWGVPAVLVVVAGIAYGESVLSLAARGVVWVVAVAWAGTGCLINGQSCGRVHCRIDGVLFPLLAIVGALNVLSVISFDWNLFWLAFLGILVGSFVPKWTWKKYS